jgi:hypothetical protein
MYSDGVGNLWILEISLNNCINFWLKQLHMFVHQRSKSDWIEKYVYGFEIESHLRILFHLVLSILTEELKKVTYSLVFIFLSKIEYSGLFASSLCWIIRHWAFWELFDYIFPIVYLFQMSFLLLDTKMAKETRIINMPGLACPNEDKHNQ